jgi:hypothetical protein
MKTILILVGLLVVRSASAQMPVDHSANKGESIGRKAPAELAYLSAANLAAVSAMLSQNKSDVEEMIDSRKRAIFLRERIAVVGQARIAAEVEVYKATGGEGLVIGLESLIRYGDRTAALPAETAKAQADLDAQISEAAKAPQKSTTKLDDAAKRLALLADEPTPRQRAQQAFEFFQATKKKVKEIEDAAAKAKANAEASTAVLSASTN